jgi:hypothetical protein
MNCDNPECNALGHVCDSAELRRLVAAARRVEDLAGRPVRPAEVDAWIELHAALAAFEDE